MYVTQDLPKPQDVFYTALEGYHMVIFVSRLSNLEYCTTKVRGNHRFKKIGQEITAVALMSKKQQPTISNTYGCQRAWMCYSK